MKEKELFKTALEIIEKYNIKTYACSIYANEDCWGTRIKLQGLFEDNSEVLDALPFEFIKGNDWYAWEDKIVTITITK